MLELLVVIAPIALIDSTSMTPIALVPLATILGGKRPYPTALAFLLGLFVSYLAMALGFLFGLSAVLVRVNAWVSHRWNNPEPADFAFEILLGLVMLVFGFRIAEKRRKKSGGREIKEGVTPAAAFGFGFVLNTVGFPGALPYFAAADQIVQADLSWPAATLAVVFYVAVFVLPLSVIVLLRALLGTRMDGVIQAIKGFFDTWGKRLVIVTLLLLGLFLVVDGAAYFLRGEPLIPIGYPKVF
jgi:cytochrome c biogenesis protein CcdA